MWCYQCDIIAGFVCQDSTDCRALTMCEEWLKTAAWSAPPIHRATQQSSPSAGWWIARIRPDEVWGQYVIDNHKSIIISYKQISRRTFDRPTFYIKIVLSSQRNGDFQATKRVFRFTSFSFDMNTLFMAANQFMNPIDVQPAYIPIYLHDLARVHNMYFKLLLDPIQTQKKTRKKHMPQRSKETWIPSGTQITGTSMRTRKTPAQNPKPQAPQINKKQKNKMFCWRSKVRQHKHVVPCFLPKP